jgi:hypothetical protein
VINICPTTPKMMKVPLKAHSSQQLKHEKDKPYTAPSSENIKPDQKSYSPTKLKPVAHGLF